MKRIGSVFARVRPLAAAIILSFAIGACVSAGYSHAREGNSLRASFASGKEIRVKVGETFSITLESNPTTGYSWRTAKSPDPNIVKPVGNEYVQGETGGRVGVGGREVWTFKAVGSGRTVIGMEYLRPWEKGVKPIKTVVFPVRVE